MSADHELLTDDFHAVLDDLPETDAIDLSALLGQGHRRLRRRRNGRIAAVAVVTVATAGLVGALIPNESTAPRPSAPTASSVSATMPTADPLTVSATFGWLPPQLVDVSYESTASPSSTTHDYDTATPLQEKPSRIVAAMLSTQAAPLPAGLGWDKPTGMQEIAPINGRAAYAQTEGGKGSYVRIIFRSGSGQIADLETSNIDMQDSLRIARGVVFGRKVFPLPIRVTGVDAPLARAGARYETVNGKWVQAGLDLAVRADQNYEAEIIAIPAAGTAPEWTGRTATATRDGVKTVVGLSDSFENGIPTADLYPEDGGTVKDDDGVPPPMNDPTTFGDPTAFLAAHVTSLGADQSHWTTSVLIP
ncbi:hypothetical protein GXW82_06770 [Streptacidiphilus sp. 4-A2]|nr:hypothetical protein [Streptacidiphilus sp. 4-A2]